MIPAPRDRIVRVSRRMSWLVTSLLWLLVPLQGLYVLLMPEQLVHLGLVAGAGFAPHPFSLPVGLAVWAVLAVISVPMLWGLWSLKGLFGGYARGEIFTVTAAHKLRHFGLALVVIGCDTPLASALLSGALSLDQPEGARKLVVSLTGNDLFLLMVGILVTTIAHVMGEAVRIAQENAEFI